MPSIPASGRDRRFHAPSRRYLRALTIRDETDTARLSDSELPALDAGVPAGPTDRVAVAGTVVNVRTVSVPDVAPPAAEREPALFVHGLGGSSLNWTDLAQLLSPQLDVQSIDLPGFGRSAPPPKRDYSIDAHTRVVVEYLERSERGPVHLVGNSMGGAISLEVARLRPDLVRTLSLVSPAVPDTRVRLYPMRHNPRVAVFAVPGLAVPAVRRSAARVSPEALVRGTIDLVFADPARYPAERVAEDVEQATARASMPWAAEALVRSGRGIALAGISGARIWRGYAGITTPSLVLWGDRDRLVAPDLAPELAGVLPRARLLVLPGVGHTAMMEDPVTTARAVMGLIEDSRATSGHAPAPDSAQP